MAREMKANASFKVRLLYNFSTQPIPIYDPHGNCTEELLFPSPKLETCPGVVGCHWYWNFTN